jgi:hypothetical protein
MTTRFEHDTHGRTERLAELQDKIAERERQLSDARLAFEQVLEQPARGGRPHPGEDRTHEDRTEQLFIRGRSNNYSPGMSRKRKLMLFGAAGLVVLITIAVVALSGSGPSWPASVAQVQTEASQACQNPDVRSEPDQVNFACAKSTTAILWVFALLTSGDNPNFGDAKSGRLGLEPISPQEGGEVAWSLNLHSPYNASNPIDSLEVAARAINNIVGGATVTGANGQPVVEPGLESSPANCLSYTGSSALRSRAGYPSVCAGAISSAAGQAALVSDVYLKWMVGAAPQAAQNAATLYQFSTDPGAPQVQAILQHLPGAKQSGQS